MSTFRGLQSHGDLQRGAAKVLPLGSLGSRSNPVFILRRQSVTKTMSEWEGLSCLHYSYDTARQGNAIMTDVCWFGNMSNITLCMDICVTGSMPALTAMAAGIVWGTQSRGLFVSKRTIPRPSRNNWMFQLRLFWLQGTENPTWFAWLLTGWSRCWTAFKVQSCH